MTGIKFKFKIQIKKSFLHQLDSKNIKYLGNYSVTNCDSYNIFESSVWETYLQLLAYTWCFIN